MDFADANWAGNIADRRPVSGYIFFIYGCPVAWSSKKQITVEMLSSEPEYVALSATTTEFI